MNKQKTQSSLKWLWLTGLLLLIDQLSKFSVTHSLSLYQSIEVLPFFSITYVNNPGAAFSFLADQSGWQRWLFTIIAAAASIGFLIWLTKIPQHQRYLAVAVAMMLSGALGNLIDRMLFGHVIDFLDFHLGNYRWPAFNVADTSIFLGVVFMLLDSFYAKSAENVA